MSKPKVSVIIPAYNAGSTINRAVDSALGQNYHSLEVVVVDDGSKDRTAEQLKAYGDKIVTITQANAGAAAARNHAVRLATGDLIAFLDSDDVWHPEKIALQTQVFGINPSLAFCTCSLGWGESEANLPIQFAPVVAPTIEIISDFSAIFSAPYFGTPSIMMTKHHFEYCGGFDESLTTAEDIDLWLRSSYGRSIARINEVLALIFRHSSGLSASNAATIFADNLKVIDNFCARNPEFANSQQSLIRKTRAGVYERWGSDMLGGGRFREARDLLLQAMKLSVSPRSTYLLLKSLAYNSISSARK